MHALHTCQQITSMVNFAGTSSGLPSITCVASMWHLLGWNLVTMTSQFAMAAGRAHAVLFQFAQGFASSLYKWRLWLSFVGVHSTCLACTAKKTYLHHKHTSEISHNVRITAALLLQTVKLNSTSSHKYVWRSQIQHQLNLYKRLASVIVVLQCRCMRQNSH